MDRKLYFFRSRFKGTTSKVAVMQSLFITEGQPKMGILAARHLSAGDLNLKFNTVMVRSPRFEPGSSAWQADVLDQTRLRPHIHESLCGLWPLAIFRFERFDFWINSVIYLPFGDAILLGLKTGLFIVDACCSVPILSVEASRWHRFVLSSSALWLKTRFLSQNMFFWSMMELVNRKKQLESAHQFTFNWKSLNSSASASNLRGLVVPFAWMSYFLGTYTPKW